jgi:hypothetical protein
MFNMDYLKTLGSYIVDETLSAGNELGKVARKVGNSATAVIAAKVTDLGGYFDSYS